MWFKIHHLPIYLGIFLLSSMFLSLLISAFEKTVYPFLPFISEAGGHRPASCIFGQLINITAVISALLFYARYKQIDLIIKSNGHITKRIWNEISFYLGVTIPIGLTLVANFQMDWNSMKIFLVHTAGAFMSFSCGSAYMIVQSKITFDLRPFYIKYPCAAVSTTTQYLRVLIATCFTLCLTFVGIFEYLAYIAFDGDRPEWYTPQHAGYEVHLTAAISEWIIPLLYIAFMLTMINELKFVTIEKIQFTHMCKENRDNDIFDSNKHENTMI